MTEDGHQLRMDPVQQSLVHAIVNNVQRLLSLFEVWLENINVFITEKILSFGINRCDHPMFFTNGDQRADHFLGEDAFVIVFEDHHFGPLPRDIGSGCVNHSVFFYRAKIPGYFTVKPHHLLVPADDAHFVGSNPVFAF